jgi:photosystem II stability/assembly factor-like uncharacterized protein
MEGIMTQRCVLISFLLIWWATLAHSQLSWTWNNGPFYAHIDDYAIGLKNGNVVIYAADSSETSLMKSTDRGETWIHVLSLQGSVVQSVATFKSNADLVYAGIRAGATNDRGIWKSTDGGTSWSYLGSQPQNKSISRIAIHPTDSTIVWVGCWRIPSNPPPPVLYRSIDGGLSWEPFEPDPHGFPNNVSVSDIAVTENLEYVWVSTYGGIADVVGVWRTRNGGRTWTREITGMDADNLHFGSLAVDPNDPDVLYAGNRLLSSTTPRKLYRTTNGTTDCKWSDVYTPSSGEYSFSDIRVSPFSSDVVYVATGFDYYGVGVLKSTDGGNN